jgi:hypothetical protein
MERVVGRPGRDRGEGPIGYLVVLLLCAMIVAALVLSGLGGQVVRYIGAAVCQVADAGGLVDGCDSVEPPGDGRPQTNPDIPASGCVPYMQREYLEETVTVPVRYVDARTNSRGTLQLIERIGPDGKPTWEVVDFTWGEGGVGTPEVPAGPVKGGIWGGLTLTNGNVYGGFSSEEEARRFYDQLREHRLGSEIKFGLRTNPVTGGLVWLGSRLPWVGDDIDRYMGGSEPDREPTESYMEGGLTGGFRGSAEFDLKVANLKFPFKGRGWLLAGTRVNNVNGEITSYYTQRGEVEVAVQIDVGDVIRRLPKRLREGAQRGLEEGLDAALDAIEGQLKGKYGNDFMLSPQHRTQMKTQIKLNPSIGFNYKHRGGTQWAVTTDAAGNLLRLTQTQDGQDVLYVRADGKAGGTGPDGKGEVTAGGQWILFAQRVVTQKDLDYTSLEGREIIDRFLRDGDTGAVERAWAQGAGTMSRLTYDNTGETTKLEAQGSRASPKRRLGMIEISRESEEHTLTTAQYYTPGVGWTEWKECR